MDDEEFFGSLSDEEQSEYLSALEDVYDYQSQQEGESANEEVQKSEWDTLLEKYDGRPEKAIFEYCFKHDICYSADVYRKLQKEKEDNIKLPEDYVEAIQADENYSAITFFNQIRQENFEKVFSDQEYLFSLSEEDRKNRQTIMEIFAYDPFKDETGEDKSQLYRDLAGMSSESMRKDVAKQKAAINIVRTYGNIEKYQRQATAITASGQVDEDTQKQLDQLLKTIANLQQSVNATAEKNNFAVKGIGSNGRGTLSEVMDEVEMKGIDEGVTNFYDIATSQSIEEISNISTKALLNQVGLTKTDYADILASQCKIVHDCQKKTKQAFEALRLCKEKIKKQKLLDELARDYKKKGISEKDIEEFINTEYEVKDALD